MSSTKYLENGKKIKVIQSHFRYQIVLYRAKPNKLIYNVNAEKNLKAIMSFKITLLFVVISLTTEIWIGID